MSSSQLRRLRWRQVPHYAAALVAQCPVAIRRAFSPTTKRVLLVAHNRLMAEYVLRLWACIRDVPHFDGYLTAPAEVLDDLRSSGAYDAELQLVRWGVAPMLPWDALLLADHAALRFAPTVPRAIVAHGVAMSRLVRGGSYYYDPTRLYWPDGRLVYGLILDASNRSRDWAAERFPDYADRIKVVGDLRVDELLAHAENVDAIRRKLALPTDRPVIAMMSTWGPDSLMETMGAGLLREVARLTGSGRAHFVVATHPNLWTGFRSSGDWPERLTALKAQGVTVLRPDDDWAPFLAATDAAVSDHTSLAATYAMLRRPIIPVHVREGVVADGTFAAAVLESYEHLSDACELEHAVAQADRRYDPQRIAPRVDDLVNHLGHSATLTRRHLVEFLKA